MKPELCYKQHLWNIEEIFNNKTSERINAHACTSTNVNLLRISFMDSDGPTVIEECAIFLLNPTDTLSNIREALEVAYSYVPKSKISISRSIGIMRAACHIDGAIDAISKYFQKHLDYDPSKSYQEAAEKEHLQNLAIIIDENISDSLNASLVYEDGLKFIEIKFCCGALASMSAVCLDDYDSSIKCITGAVAAAYREKMPSGLSIEIIYGGDDYIQKGINMVKHGVTEYFKEHLGYTPEKKDQTLLDVIKVIPKEVDLIQQRLNVVFMGIDGIDDEEPFTYCMSFKPNGGAYLNTIPLIEVIRIEDEDSSIGYEVSCCHIDCYTDVLPSLEEALDSFLKELKEYYKSQKENVQFVETTLGII